MYAEKFFIFLPFYSESRGFLPYKRIPALFYQKALDFQSKMWYTVFRDFGKLESAIRKRIEVVITVLTRNHKISGAPMT